MASDQDQPLRNANYLKDINARLTEAARTDAPLELVLAVRGRVEPVSGKYGTRWRIRTGQGHVLTFRPEFVVAFDGTTRPAQKTATPGLAAAPVAGTR
jgi:hypothetical protein